MRKSDRNGVSPRLESVCYQPRWRFHASKLAHNRCIASQCRNETKWCTHDSRSQGAYVWDGDDSSLMDQNLDMQLAALIFLAGTQCLGSNPEGEAVEMTSERTEESAEEIIPSPTEINPRINWRSFPFSTRLEWFLHSIVKSFYQPLHNSRKSAFELWAQI